LYFSFVFQLQLKYKEKIKCSIEPSKYQAMKKAAELILQEFMQSIMFRLPQGAKIITKKNILKPLHTLEKRSIQTVKTTDSGFNSIQNDDCPCRILLKCCNEQNPICQLHSQAKTNQEEMPEYTVIKNSLLDFSTIKVYQLKFYLILILVSLIS